MESDDILALVRRFHESWGQALDSRIELDDLDLWERLGDILDEGLYEGIR